MRSIILLIAILVISSHSFAGPFGTKMGDNVLKYNNIRKLDMPGMYAVDSIFNPNSLLKKYYLEFNNTGLCAVTGQTWFSQSEKNEALNSYNELSKQLTSKYGKGEISHGGLVTTWRKKLKDSLKMVMLSLQIDSKSDFVLSVDYRYKNAN